MTDRFNLMANMGLPSTNGDHECTNFHSGKCFLPFDLHPGWTIRVFVAYSWQIRGRFPSFHSEQEVFFRCDFHGGAALRFLFAHRCCSEDLTLPDLYAEPSVNFGADTVECWFSEQVILELVKFSNPLAIY